MLIPFYSGWTRVHIVQILIVNDTGLNAFVSGGQNIFVNTGLLMRTTDASQIIGSRMK